MKVAVCILLIVAAVSMIEARPQEKDNNDNKNNKNNKDNKENKGSLAIDVNREREEGTKIRIEGRQEVFRSNDGRTRAEVYGHWDRTYGGRNHGQRSYGAGGRIEHSWG